MAKFDQVKATFWSAGTYGVQPPLTDAAVKDAEQLLGVVLPAALLDLLRIQNGGQVAETWDAFPTDQATSWSEDHVPFADLMGIGQAEETSSLLDTPYLLQEWGLPSPLVLLTGDGHHWIALDYRTNGTQGQPAVTWIDTDLESETALATDFHTFIEGLTAGSTFD